MKNDEVVGNIDREKVKKRKKKKGRSKRRVGEEGWTANTLSLSLSLCAKRLKTDRDEETNLVQNGKGEKEKERGRKTGGTAYRARIKRLSSHGARMA